MYPFSHIITLLAVDFNFKRDFWICFRSIAEDPVGRVLLYQLLIEIRILVGVLLLMYVIIKFLFHGLINS